MPTYGTVAARAATLLIDISLRALILVALAGMICYLLRRASASARHAAWTLTLVALLCLPLLRACVPQLPIPSVPLRLASSQADGGVGRGSAAATSDRPADGGPASRGTSSSEGVPSGTVSSHPSTASSTPPRLPSRGAPAPPVGDGIVNGAVPGVVRPAAPHAPSPLIPLAVSLVWAVGVAVVMARTILGLVAAQRLIRVCLPVTAGPMTEAVDEARRALGVSRHVQVLTGGPSVPVPMTCGFLSPAILLPLDAADWPTDRLRAVLLHEMAHVRRGDWLLLALAQCACALYWFHPPVWLASRRMRAEGEGACDDLVLSCGVAAPDYADHLLEIVRGLSGARRSWSSTVAMARRSDVSDRLRAILGEPRNRRAVRGRALAVYAVLAVGLTASLAALHPSAIKSASAVTAPSQTSATASLPPAVLASGAPTQGAFTLADITRNAQKGAVTTPPDLVPAHSLALVPVMTGGGGTGLWIQVRGGIGYQTLTVPLDGQRHTFPFGRKTFTVNGTPTSYTYMWTGSGNASNLPDAEQPYAVWSSGASGSVRSGQAVLTLVPRQLSRQFRVTAQPLSAAGEPLSRPVDLVCQAATPTTLFAQVPTGYNTATRQMLVTVARVGASGGASWRLTNLPASVPGVKGSLAPTVTAGYGPMILHAAAAESEDLSGDPDFLNRHPARPAGGGWFFSQPPNADGHGWTGVPTVRLMLRARNTSSDFSHQNWMVRLGAMTPQWQTSPVMPTSRAITPLDVFPVYNYRNNAQWEQHDWQVGVAYPGQQHWVRVDGEFVRFAYRTEKVTFHDAEVVQDGPSGVNRLIWSAPETETTPSGISITVLNRKPGAGEEKGGQDWRFEGGNVPLLLAWHLPAGCLLTEHAPLDAALQADPPRVAGVSPSALDNTIPAPDWASLAIPGQTNARALTRGGYEPLCLAANAAPPASAPEDEGGGGSFVPPPSPLRSLKTVTLTIMVREQREVHPFHLLLPVEASFPSGWDPDSADGRSSAP